MPEALGELNFLAADREFVGKLVRRDLAAHSPAGIAAEKRKRDPSLRSG
jgi:hypothetical protein